MLHLHTIELRLKNFIQIKIRSKILSKTSRKLQLSLRYK